MFIWQPEYCKSGRTLLSFLPTSVITRWRLARQISAHLVAPPGDKDRQRGIKDCNRLRQPRRPALPITEPPKR